MDWIDLLIAGCVVFFILRRFGKKAKSLAPPVEVQHEEVPGNPQDESGDFNAEMQDFSANSPKNEDYFTYETLEPEFSTPLSTESDLSNKDVDKTVQIVENEEVKNIDLQFDADKIVTAIIYSEILKKPNN